MEQTKKALLQASYASFDYLNGNPLKKKEILNSVLWNLKVENQEVQHYQFKQTFQPMAEAPKKMNLEQWWALQDSNLWPLQCECNALTS